MTRRQSAWKIKRVEGDTKTLTGPARTSSSLLHWARIVSWGWAAIPVLIILLYDWNVFVFNTTNHTSEQVVATAHDLATMAVLNVVPAAVMVSVPRLRTLRMPWLVCVGAYALAAANIYAFNTWHVMMYYDDWAHAGMPDRPAWSLLGLG